MRETLSLTIDLESELRKIAQRQHLNDVHHLVQLVRHAMRHAPGAIDITSTAGVLALAQDGDPFSLAERDLLLAVLNGDDPIAQQAALRSLEREYGAALLALVLGFARVEIVSEGWRLTATRTGASLGQGESCVRGYRIRVLRKGFPRGVEAKELRFFCNGAAVPIRYNGRSINRALAVSGILAARFQDERGTGMLGIPQEGQLSTISYCKQGIRFGFRRFLDPEGRVVEGFWDSARRDFEPFFAASIGAGDEFLDTASQGLYEAIASQFASIGPPRRERLRRLLLAHPPLHRWDQVPLFDTVGKPFALSLRDLRELERQCGAIPCAFRRSRHLPPSLPLLTLDHVHALQTSGHALVVVTSRAPRLRWRGLGARVRTACAAQGASRQ